MWPLRVEQHMLHHVLYLQQRKKNAFHSYGTYPSLVCENNNIPRMNAELIQYTNICNTYKFRRYYKV